MTTGGRRIVRLQVHGRVQGVGFRAWTARRAAELGVSGWVRNRADGSVEALLAGEAKAVEQVIAACGEGPALARVERVEIVPAGDDVAAAGSDFRQLPTI